MDAFSTTIAAYLCGLTILLLAVLSSPVREGGPRRWTVLMESVRRRYGNTPGAAPRIDNGVSAQQDAEIEMAETPETPGPSPAELDRMIKRAADEAVARAVGTLAGAGFIDPAQRSKALLRLGFSGERYSRAKAVADPAQVAAQAEHLAPAEPARPPIPIAGGRLGYVERDAPAMEPLP